MTTERAQQRATWDAWERSIKFTAAIAWGTLELAFWGARPAALAFIGSVLGITEGVRALVRMREQTSP